MFASTFKIALRALLKHKGYSFINIFGLALGLACAVLILLFVNDELSFDRSHEHADRIYRVVLDAQAPNAPLDRFALTSRPMGRYLNDEYPEIEHVVRINSWNPSVKIDGQFFFEDQVFYAEPTFFQVFDFPLLEGNPETALEAPYTVVLTAAMAEKYFGKTDILGQSLTLNDTLLTTVTGVVEDFPATSHLSADFLVSYATMVALQPESDDEWLNLGGGYTYLLLREGVDAAAFEQKIADLVMRHFGEVLQNFNITVVVGLQPLTDIHLRSDRQGEMSPNGRMSYIYIFAAISLFVLLIACINFTNLATARSMERAKEIGVRKVVGSTRSMLMRQFLGESTVMSLLAMVLALVLIAAALPLFNTLTGKAFTFSILVRPLYLAALPGIVLVTGLLAGLYPALMLSRFSGVEVLRGAFRTSRRGVLLRKGLVVFQFAASVGLVACTFTVFKQVAFMRNQSLGFDKEQLLIINAEQLPGQVMAQQYDAAKTEFARSSSVQNVSGSAVVPGRGAWLLLFQAEGLAEEDSRRAEVVAADADYLKTYRINLIAGRHMDPSFETDQQSAILISESAAADLGWSTPEEALDRTITYGNGTERTVVGVFEDYHHASLQQAIQPMHIFNAPAMYNYFSLRVQTQDLPDLMRQLEQTWTDLFPGYTYSSFFLDEDFERQYRNEEHLTRIFGSFAGLAILIACLGLFGLAAFTAQQRTKEIGVRKVLGASTAQITLLLSKEFTWLVLISIAVATPVAYFAMDRWLDEFPYRIGLGVDTFLIAGIASLIIAWITVSYQAVKAARSEPVNALRYE